MKAKQKNKSDQEFVYRPINPAMYPEFVSDGQFQYFRFWCTVNRITYEKFHGEVRLGFVVMPEQKHIFNFDSLVAYVESQTGPAVCKSVLRE